MGRDLFYTDVSFLLLSAFYLEIPARPATGTDIPVELFPDSGSRRAGIVLVTMIYTMRKIRKFNIIDELRMA